MSCVRASVGACGTLFKRTLKMSSGSILKNPGGFRTSWQASKHEGKQAIKQTSIQSEPCPVGACSISEAQGVTMSVFLSVRQKVVKSILYLSLIGHLRSVLGLSQVCLRSLLLTYLLSSLLLTL